MNIETDRLKIRKLTNDDWKEVYEYTSDTEVMRWIPEEIFTEEDAKSFVEKNIGEDAEKFAVVLKSGKKLIGHIVFHKWFMPRTYEIGWIFNKAFHNRGYASEAAYSVLKYGFNELDLHRIIATCQPQNPASYKVMEKIGMRREGDFRKCIYKEDGEWWDEYFYAILDEDWVKSKI